MVDVITVGSAAIDIYANTHSELVKIKTERGSESLICYPSGSKVLITNVQFITGGGGTNTAVCFSRMGLKTAYLGSIGDDENGDKIKNELKKEKVRFIGMTAKNKLTNFSMLLDSLEDDRTILACKSASKSLDWKKLDKKKIRAKWMYFSSLTENAFKAGEKIAAYAKRKKIKIAFNPSSYQAKLGAKKLNNLIKHVTFLVMNREEAGLLLDLRRNTDVKKLLKGLLKIGPSIVMITEGKKGCYCTDGEKLYFLPGTKKKPIETTGAGDCFASTFVAGLAKGKDIPTAMRMALANAGSVIMHHGAKKGILKQGTLLKKMKRMPRVKISKF